MGQQLLTLLGIAGDDVEEAKKARLARMKMLEPELQTEPDFAQYTPQSTSFTSIGQQCFNGATTAQGLIVSHRHSQTYHKAGDFVDVFDPESGHRQRRRAGSAQ